MKNTKTKSLRRSPRAISRSNNSIGIRFFLVALLCTIAAGGYAQTACTYPVISVVAGTDFGLPYGGDGGMATNANLGQVYSVAVDAAGNRYIAQPYGHQIRKISTSGIITLYAGTGTAGYTGDGGAATAATFNEPTSLAIDGSGNLFVLDQTVIRKITAGGTISTYAGTGTSGFSGDGGPATAAKIATFMGPQSNLSVDGAGNLYINDKGNVRIRKVNTAGIISTVVGNGTTTYPGDGYAATAVGFGDLSGVASDAAGNLYVNADFTVKKINTSGIITTIAGTGTDSETGDGGPATDATLDNSWESIQVDAAGNVYIGSGFVTIRKINTSGIISLFASHLGGVEGDFVSPFGNGSGGPATGAQLSTVGDIASDALGNIYVADVTEGAIWKITQVLAPTTGTTSFCAGSAVTLSNATGDGVWSSSSTVVADVDAATGIVTGASAGSATITYSAGSGCSATKAVTVIAAPASITGTASVCVGMTVTLADATTGGSWASGSTGVATIGAGTGVVTGVSAGTATISYTLGSGCAATSVVTVNALPAAIAGTTTIYLGGTSSLTDATAGGSWTSSSPSVASVGSATGLVTGVAGGTATITYTLATGCTATATVTVSGSPAPVTGASTVCAGSTTTLSSLSPSGVWSSSNTGVATVGSSTGIVTGVAAGTATITYVVSGVTATATMTVIAVPAAITGASSTMCEGNTITLADATPGGTWSSSATSVATVSSGVVTGVSAGTATISYSTGCGSPATWAITVNPMPAAGTITGADGLCLGGTTTLSNATAGGTWSSNSGIASIVAGTGVVTGNAISGAMISYTVTNVYSCTSVATKYITVEGTPGNIYTFSGTGVNTSTGDGSPAYLATMRGPRDMATDASGNLYFCDVTANVIRKIAANGIITTVVGNGSAGNTGDGGPATAATLSQANGVYVDNAGNLYLSNTNSHTIRKVSASTGIITTIAGTAGSLGWSGDGGPATAAKLNAPLGITGDAAGNLYIADQNNFRVRKISTTGIISTIIGTGSNAFSGDGGPGTAARIGYVRGLTSDKAGNIYLVDGYNVVRKYVISTGIITTIAGLAGISGSAGDGGLATAATLSAPCRLAYDGGSNLYVADQGNNKVRQINLSTGIIKTAIGSGSTGFSGDGGAATAAAIWVPCGIACDQYGNVYVADANNRRIRVASVLGSIGITLAGPTSVPTGTPITFTANASVTSGVTYQWQKNGSNVGTGGTTYTNPTPANGDVYRCIQTVTPVCGSAFDVISNSITVNVYGPAPFDPASVVDPSVQAEVVLYPNPVRESFTIAATNLQDGPAAINVYDQMGKVVVSRSIVATNGRLAEQVDMSGMAGGLYLVVVTDSNGRAERLKCIKN